MTTNKTCAIAYALYKMQIDNIEEYVGVVHKNDGYLLYDINDKQLINLFNLYKKAVGDINIKLMVDDLMEYEHMVKQLKVLCNKHKR